MAPNSGKDSLPTGLELVPVVVAVAVAVVVAVAVAVALLAVVGGVVLVVVALHTPP